MKKNILICISMLNIYASQSFSTSENNVFEEKKSEKKISKLIGAAYLQDRKIRIESDTYHYKDYTEEEKIFGKKNIEGWAHVHDVKMTIKREVCGDKVHVIIEITVSGAPEDFEDKHVLESEKNLLKYILIKAYLAKLKTIQEKNTGIEVTVVPIDDYTKVTLPPQNLVFVTKDILHERVTEDKNHKAMKFITVFEATEFNELINQYFIDNVTEKKNKKSWW